jgi:hypothetical protein
MKPIILSAALAIIPASTSISWARKENTCADPRLLKSLLEDVVRANVGKPEAVTYTDVTDVTTLPSEGEAFLSCHGTFLTTNTDRIPAKFTFNRNSINRYYFSIKPDD